jgi:ABC-type branched-subunit amino acid transport system substrate-binding protein
MNFKQLCEEVGIEVAVVIAQKELPNDFWEKITLNECFSIYRKAPTDSELSKTVLAKIIEKEGIFNEWLNIYKYSCYGSELRKVALAKMIKKKGTLYEWSEVYKSAPVDSELKKAALKQLQAIYTS